MPQLGLLSYRAIAIIKAAVFVACAIPLGWLILGGAMDALGADPVERMTHTTGSWSLRLLMLTLAVSPLRKFTGWQWLARLRRTIALYAFFYALLHLLTYLVFDQLFDWAAIGKDIVLRAHITAGLVSFGLMLPLAATSTDTMMARLGVRNWRMLHRLAYLSAAAGVFHYFWLVKRDITVPACYALVLIGLLGLRLLEHPGKRARSTLRQNPHYGHRPEPE